MRRFAPLLVGVLGLLSASALALPPYANCGAWVAAIVEAPDDDLARLAFADDSLERDDPLNAFLRAEVELARLEADPDTRFSEAVYQLRAISRRMLTAQLWNDNAGLPTNARIYYRRGFPERLVTTLWTNPPDVEAILQGVAATVTRLHLAPMPSEGATPAILARIQDLEMSGLSGWGLAGDFVRIGHALGERTLRSLLMQATPPVPIAAILGGIPLLPAGAGGGPRVAPYTYDVGHLRSEDPRWDEPSTAGHEMPHTLGHGGGTAVLTHVPLVLSRPRPRTPRAIEPLPAGLQALETAEFDFYPVEEVRAQLPRLGQLARLHTLRVRHTNGEEQLLANYLLVDGAFPALTRLELPGGNDPVLEAFSASPIARRLVELRFGRSWMTDWNLLRNEVGDFARYENLRTLGVYVTGERPVDALREIVALPRAEQWRTLALELDRDNSARQLVTEDDDQLWDLTRLAALDTLEVSLHGISQGGRRPRVALGDWMALSLAKAAPPGLRRLALIGVELGDDGIHALAQAPIEGPLYELDLRGNRYASPVELQRLFAAPWFASVRVLGLTVAPNSYGEGREAAVREALSTLAIPAKVQEVHVDFGRTVRRWIRSAAGPLVPVPDDAAF